MVLHIMHFGVFTKLEDSPVYNPSGYTRDHPVYNISLNLIVQLNVNLHWH